MKTCAYFCEYSSSFLAVENITIEDSLEENASTFQKEFYFALKLPKAFLPAQTISLFVPRIFLFSKFDCLEMISSKCNFLAHVTG